MRTEEVPPAPQICYKIGSAGPWFTIVAPRNTLRRVGRPQPIRRGSLGLPPKLQQTMQGRMEE